MTKCESKENCQSKSHISAFGNFNRKSFEIYYHLRISMVNFSLGSKIYEFPTMKNIILRIKY